MDYQEFTKRVEEEILSFMPEKYAESEVKIERVTKNNGVEKCGLTIRYDDKRCVPVLYLEEFYDEFREVENDGNFIRIMGSIASAYEFSEAQGDKFVSPRDIIDFEKIKDKIVPRVVNYENNPELLSDRPYKRFLDLAITYIIEVESNTDGMYCTAVINEMLDHYGVDLDTIHELAISNMKRINPPLIMPIHEYIGIGDCDDDDTPVLEPLPYIISNTGRINGCSQILNTDALDNAVEKIGSDILIIPASTREMILLPVECIEQYDMLKQYLEDVNNMDGMVEEILSYNIYSYDSTSKQVDFAEKLLSERV